MKYRARLEENLQSETVTILEVARGLNSSRPELWEKRTYYSLDHLTPMYAKPNGKKVAPHFAYKKGFGGNEGSGGGESLEHELSKDAIAENSFVKINIRGIKDTIQFSRAVKEQPFNRGERRADLYVKISNENKFDFRIGKGLVIEIHKTNEVTKTKRQFYRNKNIAAIEVNLNKRIKYRGDQEKLFQELKSFFGQEVEATTLHDPLWKEHKAMREERLRLKQEKEQKEREAQRREQERRKKEMELLLKKEREKEVLIRQKKSVQMPRPEPAPKALKKGFLSFLNNFWRKK